MNLNHRYVSFKFDLRKPSGDSETGVVDQDLQVGDPTDSLFYPFDIGRMGQICGENLSGDMKALLDFIREIS